MTFKEFYIYDKNGKSNCVIRSLCKILNKEYNTVYDESCEVAKKLNLISFNDIPVFKSKSESIKIFFFHDII